MFADKRKARDRPRDERDRKAERKSKNQTLVHSYIALPVGDLEGRPLKARMVFRDGRIEPRCPPSIPVRLSPWTPRPPLAGASPAGAARHA
jgi:hypothetical protein